MNNTLKKNRIKRFKRTMKVRKNLRGDSQKPRLCVVKSNTGIYAQLIDDENGVTLGSISTIAKEFRKADGNNKNVSVARQIGEHIGAIAKGKDIQKVIFDRGAAKYTGIVSELADGARSAGLQF
ncbi:MAG: large subunit ribosomal protein L18 [Chlamydiales bacterium]|jgi:large subunit ribosomal protein L18